MARPTTREVRRALKRVLQTDEGMEKFLNDIYGSGSWIFDEKEDILLVTDPEHKGPGRGYIAVRRGGDWEKMVVTMGKEQ